MPLGGCPVQRGQSLGVAAMGEGIGWMGAEEMLHELHVVRTDGLPEATRQWVLEAIRSELWHQSHA